MPVTSGAAARGKRVCSTELCEDYGYERKYAIKLLRGRCGTKPGSLLKTEIPIRTGTWDVTQPGYLEVDSVAHCGASLAGEYIWSLTYTDIASQWTEGRAVRNKGAAGVLTATRTVERALPFALLGFDCDNGSEFLNHHLLGYGRLETEAWVEPLNALY